MMLEITKASGVEIQYGVDVVDVDEEQVAAFECGATVVWYALHLALCH